MLTVSTWVRWAVSSLDSESVRTTSLQKEFRCHVAVDVPNVASGWQSTQGRVASLEATCRSQPRLELPLSCVEKPVSGPGLDLGFHHSRQFLLVKGGVVLAVLHGAGATHEGPAVVSTLLAVEVNLEATKFDSGMS